MGLRSLLHSLTAPKRFSDAFVRDLGEVKLVCIVNHGLKMGKGKIAAQVGHASVKAALSIQNSSPALFEAWMLSGQQKIVLKAGDAEAIESLLQRATAAGMAAHRIHDAGRTQIPAGSLTVGAIGPAKLELIDGITSDLKLL